MKKKKILCSLLCGAILLSVAGCGKGDTQSPADMEREQSEAVLKEETQDTNLNAEGLPVLREPETFRIAVMKNVMSKNTFPEKLCVIETEKATNGKALVYGGSTAQNEPFHAADVSTEADAQSAEITIGDGIEQEPEPHVAENETAANVADAETAIADGSPETEQATETIADGGESATVAEGDVSARDEEQTEVAQAVEIKKKPKKKSPPRTHEERAADYEQRAQNAEVRAEKAREQAIKYKIKAESARTKSKGEKKQ